jgi:uncharacterized protein YlxW (UPF0749 family)
VPKLQREGPALLEHIAVTALDDDYYLHRGVHREAGVARKVSFGFVLAVIGAGVAASILGLRHQGSGAELERQALISDVIQSRTDQDRNQAIVAQLRRDVGTLERERGVDIPETAELGLTTGALAATGPGLVVQVDNGGGRDGLVTDTDLQLLVNGLWYSGAEAVSVDGERVGSLTSIRSAGDAITVNFRSIRTPYEVVALGDPDALSARFQQSPTGQFWESRHRQAHVRFDMKASSDVAVAAVPARRMDITHAQLLSTPRSQEGSQP